MIKRILGLMFVVFMGLQITASAAIIMENRTGAVKITAPDGTVTEVAADQALPAIADGSKIEIVSGGAKISATDPSNFNVILDGETIAFTPGTTANLVLSDNPEARITVITNEVVVTAPDGTSRTIKAPVVEPYTPPVLPTGVLDTGLDGGEGSRDISQTGGTI